MDTLAERYVATYQRAIEAFAAKAKKGKGPQEPGA
jgi:hypothetical protein